ncbi:MAG: DSD1 family PLP-dependent enzyme [Alphaproteobacteria bacterium]|nr:DSD1 family PLP-dependent enzyme [Alphaproteobacteria bacterium]
MSIAAHPPARIGDRLEDVDTPALIVDLDAFEHNLDRMAALLAPTGARLRAHAKTHKCAVIARQQIARGAVGQCCQKVGEAEALAWGGVPDILVSNEVVGRAKLLRLASLNRLARVGVCVDDPAQVDAIEAAAAEIGVRIETLVEIDVGAARCGVPAGEGAVPLARRIAASKHLTFGGLQAYHGSAQHYRTHEERRAAIGKATDATAASVEALKRAGLACRIVGGAGTGTFEFEAASGVYNEIQAGSYVFMDADYGRNLDSAGQPISTFRQSLFVLATVMSAPAKDRAVLDAGHKAVAVDSGLPLVWGQHGLNADIAFVGASDEHGKLKLGPDAPRLGLGEKVKLVPGHCDPTVNLHDWYVGVRAGRVEQLWPITARGAMR